MIILLLIIASIHTQAAKPIFSIDPTCYISGELLSLKCESPDTLQSIEFKKNGIVQGSCLPPFPCGSGVSGYTTPRQEGVVIIMEITEYNETRDHGQWTCTYNGNNSDPHQIQETPCPDRTTEDPDTSKQLTGTSIISIGESHSSTNEPDKVSTDAVSLISTDQVISTTTSVPKELRSVFWHLVVSVSLVTSCLFLISVVVLCVVYHKRHTKNQKASDKYLDINPSSENSHMYLSIISNGHDQRANLYGSRTRSKPQTEFSSKRYSNTHSTSRGYIPEQRSRYINTINSVDNRVGNSGQAIAIGNLSHAQFKSTHVRLNRQPRQINNPGSYNFSNGQSRIGSMNYRVPYYSYTN